uniref:NAD(P)-binding protein n=1 Tax=Caenorhabditis tropicalis TaxID=1561998 RepID=A0A1I7UIS2_9PELO
MDEYWEYCTALEGISLDGKTIAITGTTSGIGVETARSLVLKGAHLVMLNRNIQESEKQKRTFIEEKPNARIDIIQCDLNSLSSVRKAGEAYLEKGWPLHGLILNAGVMGPSTKMTSDGFEAHFGINHVAHFMLLEALLPVLRSSAPSRLVIVSSNLHSQNCVKPNSPMEKKLETLCPKDASKFYLHLYGCSKMCNTLVAFKVHRDEYSNGISTYSVHPGSGVRTDLHRDSGFSKFIGVISAPITKNASQGAATSVYCVAHPEAPSGKYWESCWDDEKSLDKKVARDEELQDALWKRTQELIGEWERKNGGR